MKMDMYITCVPPFKKSEKGSADSELILVIITTVIFGVWLMFMIDIYRTETNPTPEVETETLNPYDPDNFGSEPEW